MMLLFVLSNSNVLAFSFNPPDEKTGAPNEGTCLDCHVGNDLNASGGSLMLTVPQVYTPGQVYDIMVNLSRSGQSRWGFQMTALNENNVRAGTFATADGNTQLTETNKYIEHTSAGTAAGKRNSNQWTFKWTAPNIDVGQITFYAAGNAANNADGTAGDYIYTQSETSDAPAYGVSLAGVGSLSKTVDTSEETRYTIRVRNTGNASDTIRLTTSGLTSTRLSQPSVTLDPNATRDVTLTIPGTALSTAGKYEVKVKATSQNDSTKTDEVTTATTVPAVYKVTLAGVGDLKKTVNTGVGTSYTVRVRNSGNTRDSIRLTTSGLTSARISSSSVTLDPNATRDVTLTIPGTALTKAGTYDVKVTATSQNDSSITDEITTTTTILAVYGVTLSSVDDLTKETTNVSTRVTYRINVKNTGNTSDTISLATSGDVGDVTASLTHSSITLDADKDMNIVLTVSGINSAAAGDYDIKVTATSQGDSKKSAEITTTTTILPAYGITLTGVGELTTETSDASEGVSYTLKITNNGNTDDVIDLATSGTTATLSQASVSLGAGVSVEVMLTISGDDLATAGIYEVKVTATSQGDDTQTAEVSTTTTVLPVYGVMLESEDALTGTTMDMVAGVTYTLTVTNSGNTEDTIVLSSSAEVGIGGAVLGSFNLSDSEEFATSQLEILLAPGASADVLFTAAGDLLTQLGEYEIIVTATSQGDSTKTASLTTTTTITTIPPVYGVKLEGVGELKGATWDFLRGITYTLTVTNTGNTQDTIVLGSSAEIGIEGSVLGSFRLPDTTLATSQLEITLAADESAEVMFTAAGDLFTKLGDYEISVTATSQGDSTKSAEITTTTTIESVPWDLNADGTVNILDLVTVANQFGESGEGLSGDVNMDGTVNILDLVAVANYIGKTQAEIIQANQ